MTRIILLAVVVIAVIAIILALFRVLSFLTKRRNNLTAAQVAGIIEKHLQRTEGPWDWDEFTSFPIRDNWLDAIRLRCGQLDLAPTATRVRQLEEIIDELRGHHYNSGSILPGKADG
jgi:hypothetical protein